MQLSDSLAQVEAALQALKAALAGTDANALEASSTQLRDTFMSLAVLRQQQLRSGAPLDAALAQRIDAVGREIGPLREQLARASALTGHQLQTLLPTSGTAPTYDALAGRPARTGPARIYRSAS